MIHLLRFEGSSVDGEGEHDDETHGDEPVGGHSVQKYADDGSQQEHVGKC